MEKQAERRQCELLSGACTGRARVSLRLSTSAAKRGFFLCPLVFGLAGCSAPLSPSLPLFGAYFPSWLICAAIGVVGAVLGRVLFVQMGIDDRLPLRLFVYICLGLLIAVIAAIGLYGR